MKTRSRIMIVREKGRTSIQLPIKPNLPAYMPPYLVDLCQAYAGLLPRTGVFTLHELIERVKLEAPKPMQLTEIEFANILYQIERAEWRIPGHQDASKLGVFRVRNANDIRWHLVFCDKNTLQWRSRITELGWNIHDIINNRYARSIA